VNLCFNFWYYLKGGKVKDGVNKEGVEFYKALIDELVANGKLTNQRYYAL